MKRFVTLVALLAFVSLACGFLGAPRPRGEAVTTATPTVTSTSQPAPTRTPTYTPQPTESQPPTETSTEPARPIPTSPPGPTLALSASGPAACVPRDTKTETGVVVMVVSGDSIVVEIEGAPYQVRYIGLDAPLDTSTVEHFGPQATAKNAELVSGQEVLLVRDVSERDAANQLLRYVFVGEVFVNYELVREGFAYAFSRPPDLACDQALYNAQREARAEEAGLWAPLVALKGTPFHLATPKPGKHEPCYCYGEDLSCEDFEWQHEAQWCLDYCCSLGLGDVFRLDKNYNGLACDNLP